MHSVMPCRSVSVVILSVIPSIRQSMVRPLAAHLTNLAPDELTYDRPDHTVVPPTNHLSTHQLRTHTRIHRGKMMRSALKASKKGSGLERHKGRYNRTPHQTELEEGVVFRHRRGLHLGRGDAKVPEARECFLSKPTEDSVSPCLFPKQQQEHDQVVRKGLIYGRRERDVSPVKRRERQRGVSSKNDDSQGQRQRAIRSQRAC